MSHSHSGDFGSSQQDDGSSSDYDAIYDLISGQGGQDDDGTQDGGQDDGGQDDGQYDDGQYDDGTTDTADGPYPTQTDDGLGDYGMGDSGTDYPTSTSYASDAFPTTQVPTPSPAFVSSATASPSLLTAMPSATPDAQSSDSNSGSSKRSTGSAAAIGVTVTLLILAACAALFFFCRKKHMNNRKNRHATWSPPYIQDGQVPQKVYADLEGGRDTNADHFETIDINEKAGATILPDNITYQTVSRLQNPIMTLPVAPPPLHPTGYAPPRIPSPPPISTSGSQYAPAPVGIDAPMFNDSSAPLISSTQFSPTVIVPSSIVIAPSPSSRTDFGAKANSNGTLVVVARTFIPALPDELRIQTGEQVRMVCRYDDGWALVERMKSGAGVESGVVPAECLESCSPNAGTYGSAASIDGAVSGMGLAQLAVEGWRLSKRKSSLHAGPTTY